MNTSLLLKNAILNLYKTKIYTVDYAIIKATELANKMTATDVNDLITYLAEEQVKEMEKEIIPATEETPVEENVNTEEEN